MSKILVPLCLAMLCGTTFAQDDPGEEARALTLDVIRKTQDVHLSLQQHAQSVRRGAASTSTALDTASGDALLLDAELARLEALVPGLDHEQAELSRHVVQQAKAQIDQVHDTLIWQDAPPSTGASLIIDHCKGFINCLFVKSGCTGCFIYYVGVKDGTCYDPCPYD